MIQNPTILEKLSQKTQGDKVMRQFIENIMANESEGKNFRKFYQKEIERCAKKKGET